jgi:hypothetical protein
MATGRTKPKYIRVYADGYDLSGFGRTIGPLTTEQTEIDMTVTMADTVKGYYKGDSSLNIGTFNGIFDNTASTGIHTLMGTAGGQRTVIVAYGIRAAPADGDPCFCGQFIQTGYSANDDAGALAVTIPFGGWSASATSLNYGTGWGTLLHASAVRTSAAGVNTAAGFDNLASATTTTGGGYMVYQTLAGNGTVTLSVDDSANNTDWLALAGATSGSFNCTTPQHGLVALGTAATVRRYLRWQIAFGTATTCTFLTAFVRGYYGA